MALGPQFLTELFQKDLKSCEEEIDSMLSGHTTFGQYRTITTKVPKGMNREVFTILKEKYLAAGWKSVEWKSEQRDGDWLEFKA